MQPATASLLLVSGFFVMPLSPGEFSGISLIIRIPVTTAGLGVVAWLVARQVRRALSTGRARERISVLLTLVTVVVVFFSALYVAMEHQFSGIATKLDALYFSIVTLCTVGYGDITPVSETARALVIVQMLFDLVIVSSAISVVVGAMRTGMGPPPGPAPRPEPDPGMDVPRIFPDIS